MKMQNSVGAKHLARPSETGVGDMTLCGKPIKPNLAWKSVTELTGDECINCAENTANLVPSEHAGHFMIRRRLPRKKRAVSPL